MKTSEVNRQDWRRLCEQLNEDSRGALITMHHVGANGAKDVIIESKPLRTVALDETSDPCNDNLVIEAGVSSEKPLRHVIVEPIHVRLKEGGNGRYNEIEIQAEDGLTVILVNPGLKPLPNPDPALNKGKPSGKDAENKTEPGRKGDYKLSGWPEDAPTQRVDGATSRNESAPDNSRGRNKKAGSSR